MQVMHDVVSVRNTNSDRPCDERDKDEPVERLNEPAKISQEYAVDGIVRGSGRSHNNKYVAPCFSYTSTKDTVHLPDTLPQQIIIRFWHLVQGNEGF